MTQKNLVLCSKCKALYNSDAKWNRIEYEPGTSEAYTIVASIPKNVCPMCLTKNERI